MHVFPFGWWDVDFKDVFCDLPFDAPSVLILLLDRVALDGGEAGC